MAEVVYVNGGRLDSVAKLEAADVTIQNPWAGPEHNWLPTTVAFCNYAAPRVTGTGEKIWNTVLTIVSFALLIWGLYEQIKINNMRYGIAKAYANMATSMWARFNQRYKPLENSMIQESLAGADLPVDYEGTRARQDNFSSQAWGAAAKEYAALARRYHICPDQTSIWNTTKALSNDDMVNFGYREAEAFTKDRNDLRWNQRAELLNIGRNHAAIGAQFAKAADGILSGLGEGARTMTLGAFQAIGYLYDRNMLSFPFWFTRSSETGRVTGAENTVITPSST
jgi:hypothetical protein